jgi:K+-sensing histidine kinase KdpD
VNSSPQPADPRLVAEDLSRFSEPAWIIDPTKAQVTAANAAAASLWHGTLRAGASLPSGTPALLTLQGIGESEQLCELQLGVHGNATLSCRCRKLPESNAVLVVAQKTTSQPTDPAPAASAPTNSKAARAALAHELRTPLSAIMALAEVMKDERLGPMGNARYLVYASDIYDSAKHALSVLGAMLLGESDEPPAPQTDVEDTVRKCLSAMRALAAQASVQLETNFTEETTYLAMDRRSLTQILLNLLMNALKFTPAGGLVTVATRREQDGGLSISVIDTGKGMQQAEIDRLQSGDDQVLREVDHPVASGFGLPLVKALARASGGQVEIASTPGRGTRVTIVFPPERTAGKSAP